MKGVEFGASWFQLRIDQPGSERALRALRSGHERPLDPIKAKRSVLAYDLHLDRALALYYGMQLQMKYRKRGFRRTRCCLHFNCLDEGTAAVVLTIHVLR